MNLILADDHALFRDTLSFLLDQKTDHHILASVETMADLRQAVSEQEADLECILLDYNMPEGDTLAEATYLKRKYPQLKLAFLTGTQSGITLKHIESSGVDGILHKEDAVESIVDALNCISQGQKVVSQSIQEKIANDAFDLTNREFHILCLIIKGKTSAQIGEALNLSPRTVEKHKQNIMHKMQCSNTSQLIATAHRLNIEAH